MEPSMKLKQENCNTPKVNTKEGSMKIKVGKGK
jgi:hypothetical protein